MKQTNNTTAKVFMANEKFYNQKVQDLFKGEENQTRKFSPMYNGKYLEVWVEFYDGKYYLSFKQLGNALGDYSKRIRKTMTLRQIDALIAEYYDERDEMHRKCVEVYNAAMNPKNGAKKENPKEDAPKEDAKRNLSEKVRNSAKGMQYEYVLDCVKNSSRATDEGKEFADDAEVLQFFADCFGDEFNHEYNKRLYPNISERIGNYLQGLPSVCSVDYWYDDIIRIGKDWGYCQTDKKAQSFCENWFTQLGCRIVEMCNKLGVQI